MRFLDNMIQNGSPKSGKLRVYVTGSKKQSSSAIDSLACFAIYIYGRASSALLSLQPATIDVEDEFNCVLFC